MTRARFDWTAAFAADIAAGRSLESDPARAKRLGCSRSIVCRHRVALGLASDATDRRCKACNGELAPQQSTFARRCPECAHRADVLRGREAAAKMARRLRLVVTGDTLAVGRRTVCLVESAVDALRAAGWRVEAPMAGGAT